MDERGDVINQVEYEEILSIDEEVVTVNFEEGRVVESNTQKKDEEKDENNDMEENKEIEKETQTAKSIAGIEHRPDLVSSSTRPYLPRKSKAMHKVIPDRSVKEGTTGKLGKGSNKKSSQ